MKRALANMLQAEDYIKKQSDEHQRINRIGPPIRAVDEMADYLRRFHQNIHEEEIKIDPLIVVRNHVEPLQAQINRILELNYHRRQELM